MRRLVLLALLFGAHFLLATGSRGLLASFRHQQSHTPSAEFNLSRQVSFYPHPTQNRFQALGQKYNTDKVGRRHNYQTVYGRAFEQCNAAKIADGAPFKLLEIGLGCNMEYGAGHSAQVWREYIPQAEVWFGEYNYECVQQYKPQLEALGLAGVVTGDQADIPTLESWVSVTGGGFDLIVDDGGHTNMQLYNSFAVLFDKALKPGGLYVMEDIMTCRTDTYRDGDGRHITLDIIKDWMDDLVMSRLHRKNVKTPEGGPGLAWRRPPRLKSVECSTHYCALTKCFDDDEWCNAIEEETQPLEPHDPRAPAAAEGAEGETGSGQVPAALGAKAVRTVEQARAVVFKRGAGGAGAGGESGAGGEGGAAAAARRRSKQRRAEEDEEEEGADQARRRLQQAAAEEEAGEEVEVEVEGRQQQQPWRHDGISGVRSGMLWRHHGMPGR